MRQEEHRTRGAEGRVRVACIQFAPRVGHKEENVARSMELLTRAAAEGGGLCILPELSSSGYVFNARVEAYELAEPVPEGPTTHAWMKVARERKVLIVAGIAERAENRLYNSAVVVGPDGFIGKYRKMHLWHEEKLFFEPGDLGFPVFTTMLGCLGLCICYDLWFPETLRLLAVQGADIVCVPTNWVPMPGQPAHERPMAVNLCMTAAHCNGIYVAAADRVGTERDQPFLGHSVIVNPLGWSIAGPASPDKEEIIYADCNLVEARRARTLNDLNVLLRDRRTDVYDATLGTGLKPRAF